MDSSKAGARGTRCGGGFLTALTIFSGQPFTHHGKRRLRGEVSIRSVVIYGDNDINSQQDFRRRLHNGLWKVRNRQEEGRQGREEEKVSSS